MLNNAVRPYLNSVSGLFQARSPPGCPISARSRPSKLSNLHKHICANGCLSNVDVHGGRALVPATLWVVQISPRVGMHCRWEAIQEKKEIVWEIKGCEEYRRLVCGRCAFHSAVWYCVLYWYGTAMLLFLIGYFAVFTVDLVRLKSLMNAGQHSCNSWHTLRQFSSTHEDLYTKIVDTLLLSMLNQCQICTTLPP